MDERRIYTSYFANWRNFPSGAVVISITQYPPKGWKDLELKSCAPTVGLLRDYKEGLIDEFIFKQRYRAQLEKDRNLRGRIIAVLKELLRHGDVVLCCYEKSGDFCHRHILAEWLAPELKIKEL